MIAIYSLSDPRDHIVRYVGKTNDMRIRFKTYRACRVQGNSQLNDWLRELRSLRLLPEMKVLQSIPHSDWPEAERYWIKHFRETDNFLLNISSGGVGGRVGPQAPKSEETKRKLSEIKKRWWQDHPLEAAELAKKMRESARTDRDYRKKISEGVRRALDHAGLRKRWSLARIGKKHSAETRAKMSESRRIAWQRPEYRNGRGEKDLTPP